MSKVGTATGPDAWSRMLVAWHTASSSSETEVVALRVTTMHPL